MKNRQKAFYGITVIFVAAIFTLAGCKEDDSGGGGIPVKLRAYNNNGIAPSLSMASARVAMDIMPMAADNSFSRYTTFYGDIGTHITDITPSKFVLATGGIYLYSNDGQMMDVGQGLFDFTKGITFVLDDVEPGVTCAAMSFMFTTGGIAIEGGPSGWSMVEFDWPSQLSGKNLENITTNNFYGMTLPGIPAFGITEFIPSLIGGKASLPLMCIDPYGVQQSFQIATATPIGMLGQIVYGAGSRRYYYNEAVPTNEIIPGLNSLNGGVEIGGNLSSSVVIPFTPINVPSSAKSVTFHISWDLTGIISLYQKGTDYIFVLKNGWWNGLYLNATVE
jgi:hypothetical protein